MDRMNIPAAFAALLVGVPLAAVPLAAFETAAPQDGPALPGPAADDAGSDAAAAPPDGLAGAFPDYPPDSLGPAAFDRLGPNWKAWSEETGELVDTLYDPSAAAAEQRRAVRRLRVKLGTIQTALRNSRYDVIEGPLRDLYGPLERRVTLADAAQDAVAAARSAGPTAAAGTGVNRRLVDALDALGDTLAAIDGGSAWLGYVKADALRSLAAGNGVPAESGFESAAELLDEVRYRLEDGGDLDDEQAEFVFRPAFRRLLRAVRLRLAAEPPEDADGYEPAAELARAAVRSLVEAVDIYEREATDAAAGAVTSALNDIAAVTPGSDGRFRQFVRVNFRNYNLRVTVSELFMKKFFDTSQRNSGPVNDFFLGARVTGCQVTDTQVRVDVKPAAGVAKFEVELTGVANTSTLGVTDQARVRSVGRSPFRAVKPIIYNGESFLLGPTQFDADPSIRNVGISTKYDKLFFGLFRKPIQRYALKEANKRSPQARARAREKLTENVVPKLNEELGNSFAELNGQVGAPFRMRADRLGVAPRTQTVNSTETEILLNSLIEGPGELSGGRTPPAVAVPVDGVVLRVHESLLNNGFDRVGLAGRTLNDREVARLVIGFLSDLLGRPLDLPPEDGREPTFFTFADADPVRFQISDGAIRVVLRTGLVREDADDLPTQVVTVPLKLSMTPTGIRYEPGTIAVSPLAGGGGVRQIATAGIMRDRIGGEIEAGELSRSTSITTDDGRTIPIAVTDVTAQDGWLTVIAR